MNLFGQCHNYDIRSLVIGIIKNPGIRAAIIEPVGGHGGMDYYDFGLCEGLQQAGVDVVLFTCDETVKPKSISFRIEKGYRKIYGKDTSVVRAFRYAWGSVRTLMQCCWERRSICHFHWFHVGPLELFNIILAKILLRKVVVTAHDVEAFSAGLTIPVFARFSYSLCDAVIAHNKISRDELVKKIGISNDNIHTIPHGNYLHAIGKVPEKSIARAHLNLPKNSKVLLFFGQIKDVKGLDILLNALHLIVKQFPDVLLLIAGKVWRTDFSKYERLINEYGLSDFCKIDIRYIPDTEIANYYSAADMVVLPYKKIYQSGVLFMAMSYGRMVVVSDLPGMMEVLVNGKTGLVFHSENAEHLAKIILSVLDKPDLLERLANNGKQLMKEQYGWDKIGKTVAVLYESLGVRDGRL